MSDKKRKLRSQHWYGGVSKDVFIHRSWMKNQGLSDDSFGGSNLRPTAMLFRNLASMDVEESIRANSMDGVVLLAGCDKTTPALLMGASGCDLDFLVGSRGAEVPRESH